MAELENATLARGDDSGAPAAGKGKGLKALFHGKRGATVMIVGVGVLVAGYVVLRSRGGRTAGAQTGLPYPNNSSTQAGDVVGQQLTGLQSQIGNLVSQVSSASVATDSGVSTAVPPPFHFGDSPGGAATSFFVNNQGQLQASYVGSGGNPQTDTWGTGYIGQPVVSAVGPDEVDVTVHKTGGGTTTFRKWEHIANIGVINT